MFRIVEPQHQLLNWYDASLGHYQVEADAIDDAKRYVEANNKNVVVQKWMDHHHYVAVASVIPQEVIQAKVIY